MENTFNKIESLLKNYNRIAGDILDITDSFWDPMHYDITGYLTALYEEGPEYIDIDALEKQVNTAESLLNSLKNLNYIYG